MSAILRVAEFDRRPDFYAPMTWTRWVCGGGVATLIAVGLLLLARRVAGAVTADLPPLHLLATAIIAALAVFGGRIVWRRMALSRERREAEIEGMIGWGGSAAVVLLALGCSLGRGIDWLLWLPLVAADQWQLRWFLNRSGGIATTGRGFMPLEPAVDDEPIAADELQRLVRVREADGGEAIHGTLRAEFVAGQRQATLHVGFCPPLERLPTVEAEVCEGPDAEVKVAQAFTHGARLEVRLATAAEEDCAVVVEVSAKPQAASGEMGRG